MVHPKEHPWYAIQRRIRSATKSIHRPNLAGLGDGIGIDRVTYMTRGTLFQMFGKVQDPLIGDSSTDARGHRRRRVPSARRRESVPRCPVERALSWMLRCS